MSKFVGTIALGLAVSASARPVFEDVAAGFARAFPDLSPATVNVTVDKLLKSYNETEQSSPVNARAQWACPKLDPQPPATKITDLRPGDIGALGGIGDSVSTGCNAESTSLFDLRDYPGLSWVMGGDGFDTSSEVMSVGNALQHYAGKLDLSFGTGNSNMGSNYAKNGAIAQDMPAQARSLDSHFKSILGTDYEKTWKLVNIFIGGNNVCKMCEAGTGASQAETAAYIAGVKGALDELVKMPRTFVNVALLPDFTQLAKFKSGLGCGIALGVACPCASSDDEKIRDQVRARTTEYNNALQTLAAEYATTDDWSLVLQPALVGSDIPSADFLSKADCFHPAASGQAAFATGLWNNLISPAASKKTWAAGDTVQCATADTKLYIN